MKKEQLLAQNRALGHGRVPGPVASGQRRSQRGTRGAALRDLAELLSAVDEPMDVGRFVRNLGDSVRLTRLRIPGNPVDARNKPCGTA